MCNATQEELGHSICYLVKELVVCPVGFQLWIFLTIDVQEAVEPLASKQDQIDNNKKRFEFEPHVFEEPRDSRLKIEERN